MGQKHPTGAPEELSSSSSSVPSLPAAAADGIECLDGREVIKLDGPNRISKMTQLECLLAQVDSEDKDAVKDQKPSSPEPGWAYPNRYVADRLYKKGQLYRVPKLGWLEAVAAGFMAFKDNKKLEAGELIPLHGGTGLKHSGGEVIKKELGHHTLNFLYPEDGRSERLRDSIGAYLSEHGIDETKPLDATNQSHDGGATSAPSDDSDIPDVQGPYGMNPSISLEPVIKVLDVKSRTKLSESVRDVFKGYLNRLDKKILLLEVTAWMVKRKYFKRSYLWTSPSKLNKVILQPIKEDGSLSQRSIDDNVAELDPIKGYIRPSEPSFSGPVPLNTVTEEPSLGSDTADACEQAAGDQEKLDEKLYGLTAEDGADYRDGPKWVYPKNMGTSLDE